MYTDTQQLTQTLVISCGAHHMALWHIISGAWQQVQQVCASVLDTLQIGFHSHLHCRVGSSVHHVQQTMP